MFDQFQMKSVVNTIESMLKNLHGRDIILANFGQMGMQIKNILNQCYGREEKYIIDDRYARYNPKIHSFDFLKTIDCSKLVVLFSVLKPETRIIYDKYRVFFNEEDIYCAIDEQSLTKCGRHSTGVLCNHWLVEEVGSFCSFAEGCDVVSNHAVDYISTAPFIHDNDEVNETMRYYHRGGRDNNPASNASIIPGVVPKGKVRNFRRIKIGNDVWLGKNCLITNGSDIGNGVIAGAGAVITKPVPDYAVVAGVPARIMRYRYTPEQIAALNSIQWWNWTDDEIRDRYEDFFVDVDTFIKKYS